LHDSSAICVWSHLKEPARDIVRNVARKDHAIKIEFKKGLYRSIELITKMRALALRKIEKRIFFKNLE